MEFEEMQTIWNAQNDEKLYAINEEALHASILRKSNSAGRLLDMFELVMIGLNAVVGIVLILDALRDDQGLGQYILAGMFLLFFVYALIRRFARRKDEVQFDQTMLGELEKAIWRVEYLIRQGRSIVFWYVLPLLVVASVSLLLNSKLEWALGLLLVVGPLSYLGGRWEVNKFYLPKKIALESLREKLVASQLE